MFKFLVALSLGLAISSFASAQGKISKTFNLEYDHVPGELIIKFKKQLQIRKSARTSAIKSLGATEVRTYKTSKATLVKFENKRTDLLATAKQIAARSDVEYVEANTYFYMDAKVPNDPRFNELYGLHNEGETGGATDSDIDALEAWDISTGSKNVVVGVIDTGVDYSHPDIAPNYWTNPGESGTDDQGRDKKTNGIDDDGNGYIDDWRGWDFVNDDNDPMDDNNHGTHCAGTIGAKGNDSVGIVGVNWDVSMVGIKFLSGSGSGSLDDAVQSIEYATTLGLTMTSNSWGGGGFSQTMADAISAAEEAGILFIAAAGNSSANNDANPHYPSSYDHSNIIAVAATDHNDNLATFSCYGANTVDVAAPGVQILSTIPGDKYDEFSGTSMATPHVAGLAALIKATFPKASADEIKFRIMSNTDYVAILDSKMQTGGRINAFRSLEIDTVPPGVATEIAVSDSTFNSVALTWNAAGDDGAEGRAKGYEVRMSKAPVTNMTEWDAAQSVGMLFDNGSGSAKGLQLSLTGLEFNSEGFVTIRAIDNVGNMGALASSTPYAVKKVMMVSKNEANSMDGITADKPWGLATEGDNSFFSDSPAGDYENSAEVSMTLPAVTLGEGSYMLTFDTKYAIENGYDNGYVEISTDGGETFEEMDKFTGRSGDWKTVNYNLNDFADETEQVVLRFRFKSDSSISDDGWFIDNVTLFTEAKK